MGSWMSAGGYSDLGVVKAPLGEREYKAESPGGGGLQKAKIFAAYGGKAKKIPVFNSVFGQQVPEKENGQTPCGEKVL